MNAKADLLPKIYPLKSITQDTSDVFSLVLEDKKEIPFLPGQFNMLYLFGFGQVAISLSGHPEKKNEWTHTIRAVGKLTEGLQRLRPGDEIGITGPFGNSWPLPKKGTDVVVIAGGLGLAPLRPLLYLLADHRADYKSVTLLYGAKKPDELLFQDELETWKKKGFAIEITVDIADANWKGKVGVVTKLIPGHMQNPQNKIVYICGPEIMMKFSLIEVTKTKVPDDQIYLSIERNMQCGVGFCGHCQYGPYFVCKDGPVFSYDQLKPWFNIEEL